MGIQIPRVLLDVGLNHHGSNDIDLAILDLMKKRLSATKRLDSQKKSIFGRMVRILD
jgi:hypothetical protein